MLELTRRRGLAAVVTASALALSACGGLSESTTGGGSDGAIDRLQVIVPADPGGGWDQTGRAMQKVVQDNELVGSAQVVNVPGAGGTVGLTQLANEKDPNTLMVMGLVMVGAIETNQAQVTLDDTTPIAELTEEQEIVVVPADSPYQDINDLIEDVKAKGKGVSITGGSAGGADHILAGLMLKAADVPEEQIAQKLNYIPYSGGGESLAALLGNKVDAGISGVAEYAEQVKSGKLRALAVSGAERTETLPDVPTLTESGVDVELTNWRGVVAPGNVDDAQADKLTDLVTEMHGTDDWQQVLSDNEWGDALKTGDEYDTFLQSEVETVRETLRSIGLVK